MTTVKPFESQNSAQPRLLEGGQLLRQLSLFFITRSIVNSGFRLVYPFLPAIARGLGVTEAAVTLGITARSALAEAGREIARLVDDDAEVVIDTRPRRDALASILEADDLVIMPARLGASPFHRDAAAVASLPVGCSVGVPVRPRATAGFVHATATMVAGRAG